MVGAVSPSSKFLMRKMLANINFKEANVIVEYGPGTGVFTREIVKRMKPTCTLIIFELHEDFFKQLEDEFNDNPFIIIKNESAENIGKVVEEKNLGTADFVISSLPLANFPAELIQSILKNTTRHLAHGGKYVQFQYSLTSKKRLQEHFNSVQINFTARNIPPAFIYTCSNRKKID